MIEIDLTSLMSADNEFMQKTATLGERFYCEWDDPVHDSYGIYVKQMQECSLRVHDIRDKAETIRKEAGMFHIEELVQRASELCKEADSI